MECYLSDLNRALLDRNQMRIIQLYLVEDVNQCTVEVERSGKGEIVWVPSLLNNALNGARGYRRLWSAVRRRLLGDQIVSHHLLHSTLGAYAVDLAVFHWISEDSEAVIHRLSQAGVPVAVVNHFQNSRLQQPMIRRQLAAATAVGGVSEIEVPAFLANRFTNLSDAVDFDFFRTGNARVSAWSQHRPILFLPARITPGKGHLDAIRCLGILRRAGVPATLVFAGRAGAAPYVRSLMTAISEEGVQHTVIMAGELNPEELRDLYAASDVVIFPTSAEGLGRVLLEAQAMERPVVAYRVGGVSEAVRHNSTGYLVPEGDIGALADRIVRLLKDESERRAMGIRGREYVVEKFSIRALAARHEAFYSAALRTSQHCRTSQALEGIGVS